MTEKPGLSGPAVLRWDGEVAQRWLLVEDAMDRALRPFGDAALSRAQARLGERVIDVGCGCGDTTIALAQAVGGAGHVLGVDVAAPMVARARQRVGPHPQVEIVAADAQTFTFGAGYDLVFSRFGVMFFAEPEAAFRNLAGSLRPGGRLAFICWRSFEENPWIRAGFSALREVVPDAAPPPVAGPGPFALADRAATKNLLARAGLGDVSIQPVDLSVCLGADIAGAVLLSTNTGPVGRALPAVAEDLRPAVRARIGAVLRQHLGPAGVFLPGAAWVVLAHR